VIFFKKQGQFKFPKSKYPGVFLLFILINALVYACSYTIDPPGDLAFRIECFGIREVIDKRDKTFCGFIGVIGGRIKKL
jgi:hypothetical protein